MIGIDLFFKGLASCFKIAEKGLDSSLRMMESLSSFAQGPKSPRDRSEPSETPRRESAKEPSEKMAAGAMQKQPEADAARTAARASAEPPVEPPSAKKAKTEPPQKSAPKAKEKPSPKKTSSKTSPAPKKTSSSASQSPTATDLVRDFILESGKGVTTAEIREATGFEPKKIQNIVYKLKKKNLVKNEKKGVYIKT